MMINEEQDNLNTAMNLLGDMGLAKPEGRAALQDIVYLLQEITGKREYKFLWHNNRLEAV